MSRPRVHRRATPGAPPAPRTGEPDLVVDRLEVARPVAGDRLALDDVRLLIVGSDYAPVPERSAAHTTALARQLARSGAQVTVLTGTPDGWSAPVRTPPGGVPSPVGRGGDGAITVVRHRLRMPGRFTAPALARYEAGFAMAVTRARVASPVDVVIGVSPSVAGALAASRLARRFGAGLVIVVHHVLAADPSTGGLVRQALARMEGAVLRQADVVAVEHEFLRPQVAAHDVRPERVHRLPGSEGLTGLLHRTFPADPGMRRRPGNRGITV